MHNVKKPSDCYWGNANIVGQGQALVLVQAGLGSAGLGWDGLTWAGMGYKSLNRVNLTT